MLKSYIFVPLARASQSPAMSFHHMHKRRHKVTQGRYVRRMPSIPESLIRRNESDLSSAASVQTSEGEPRQGERDASVHKGRENAQTIWRRVRDWPAPKWPAHVEARGDLTIKISPDSRRAARVVCAVQHGVLRLSAVGKMPDGPRVCDGPDADGRSRSEHTCICIEVPVEDLAVGLQRGRSTMLTIAKLHKDVRYDEVCCFADDQATRNKWIGTFRRMGVPIFDEHEGP